MGRQLSDSPQKLAITENCTTPLDASRGVKGAKKFDAEKSTLHQRRAHLKPALATLIHGKLVPLPERSAGEFTVAAKRVEADVELQELGAVAIEVTRDPF